MVRHIAYAKKQSEFDNVMTMPSLNSPSAHDYVNRILKMSGPYYTLEGAGKYSIPSFNFIK